MACLAAVDLAIVCLQASVFSEYQLPGIYYMVRMLLLKDQLALRTDERM